MAAVDPNKTFVKEIERTNYASVLRHRLQYEIYIHKEGLPGNLHRKIVLRAAQYPDLGYITLELSKDSGQVRAQSITFDGDVKQLVPKGYFETSLEAMAEFAMRLLNKMGEYNLLVSNCQDFCNYFLKGLEKKPSSTTVEDVAKGVVFVGFVALTIKFFQSVADWLKGNKANDDD